MLFNKYRQRKRPAALALAVAFMLWDIAIISLFVFRLLAYLNNSLGYLPIFDSVSLSDIGINIGYAFSALSNIFILTFVALVFAQSNMFRITKMFFPIMFALLNGITVGLIVGSFTRDYLSPEYALAPTIYHLAMTFITFILLVSFTFRPLRSANYRWEKAGFRFIITSGISGFLVYLSFAIDYILGPELLGVLTISYTPFFFIAYGFAIVMCVCAYLGYVMPNFVRNWFKEKPAK